MNITERIAPLFSVLLLLAGITWLALTHHSKIKFVQATNLPEHRFTALDVQQFDTTGHRVYHLTSPTGYHLPQTSTHHLSTPHILITKDNQPVWTVESQQAIVTPKAEEIKFIKQVSIHHDTYKNQPAGVLNTELLSYFPKKKQAHTPLEITWDQGNNHLEGIGMQANLVTHDIELLKNVQGTYRPSHD
jgi:lipopolysaccharide export system protein LptC